MCGIAAVLCSESTPEAPPWPFWAGGTPSPTNGTAFRDLTPSDLDPLLLRRGPDASLSKTLHLGPSAASCSLHLSQTVLSHRGQPPKTLSTLNGNALLFNGEIYAGLPLPPDGSDMRALAALLDTAAARAGARPLGADTLYRLDALRGPWTFVFWHAAARRLYFARDALGRRSLLLRVVPARGVVLVSAPPAGAQDGFVEVPPVGLAFAQVGADGDVSFRLTARESCCVAPRRIGVGRAGEMVAGSDRKMYVSYLPSQWLRGFGDVKQEASLSLEESAEGFIACLRRSLQRRLVTNRLSGDGQSRYAVLFSGGIDSLVIARLLDECLPPEEDVQLINVGFGLDASAIARCPDRVSAISGLEELRRVSQTGRRFTLCCADVSPEQTDDILAKCVRHLLHPCDQPMDASIGTALWMAARGEGSSHDDVENSAASARILFSGLGADELMGGYKGRHRTIFRTEGVEGIKKEMDADLSRLWFRNLGRDDRIIADHGKEVRHPYLDEDLISFVTSLPLQKHVCDLSKPDGVGDKHLLRRAAALLGLPAEAVSRAKRAMQFGSRSKQVIERKPPP